MEKPNFEKISDEKKERVINAGILCFGRSGYAKTSIAEIAVEAGISKAAVFHYFDTKEDLFLYLVAYAKDLTDDPRTLICDDYFEVLKAYIHAHYKLIKKHPGMFEFVLLVNHMVANGSLEALNLMSEDYQNVTNGTIFKDVIWDKFKDEYDAHTISNITTWVGNGFLTQLGNLIEDQDIMAEIEKYIDILKVALYKQAYL